jgi:hypothetical protein
MHEYDRSIAIGRGSGKAEAMETNIGAFETNAVSQRGSGNLFGQRIDKRLVHKSYDESVLVSRIEAVHSSGEPAQERIEDAAARTDHFHATLNVDPGRIEFFEHECGHIPGICLIDAAEQISVAIVHMFYKVPLEIKFVITECSAQFLNVAKISDPLVGHQTMCDHVYRKGRLVSMRSAVVIRQGQLVVARMSGTLVLLTKNQLAYLEQRSAT